jgi:predicted O-methyltransferase YrrM
MDLDNHIPGCISPVEGSFLTHLSSICTTGSIVNIGCFKGRSLRYILDGHPPPLVTIYAVDLHAHLEDLQTNVLNHDTHNQITIVQGSSTDPTTLSQIPSNISLIFIDGDHTYPGALADLTNFWDKLLPNGVIVLHDTFDVNGTYHQPGVKEALTTFMLTHQSQCIHDDWYEGPIHKVDSCAVLTKSPSTKTPSP